MARSDSPLGTAIGLAVAGLAVGLLALDRFTDVAVPYGYDEGPFLLGALVAVAVVLSVGWRYRDSILG